MADKGLVTYIQKQRAAGTDDETIRETLQANNDTDAIDAAFTEADQGPAEDPGEEAAEDGVEFVSEQGDGQPWLYGLFTGRIGGFRWFVGGIVQGLFINGALFLLILVLLPFGQTFTAAIAIMLPILMLVASVLSGIVGLSLTVRRLHDKGQTGWLALLTLVPIVNLALFIYLLFPASESANQYGVRDRRSFYNAVFNISWMSEQMGNVIVILLLALYTFFFMIGGNVDPTAFIPFV